MSAGRKGACARHSRALQEMVPLGNEGLGSGGPGAFLSPARASESRTGELLGRGVASCSGPF